MTQDQLILYDQALITYLTGRLPALLPGRTTQILVATGRKGFSELYTAKVVDNRTLTFPRITIRRVGRANDPLRYNATILRRLGWCDPPDGDVEKQIRRGRFPAPITINYQIDLWTRFVGEMNLWEQDLLFEFASQYIYLSITPNQVWGSKQYIVHLEGELADNSDLEPGEGERQERRTLQLRAECWLFDQELTATPIAKRFDLVFLDFDDLTQYDVQMLPPEESIGTGDGVEVTFTATLDRTPVLAHTPVIQTVIGGTTEVVHDDGAGNLVGDRASGTINYVTGAVSVTFTATVDDSEDVAITYFTDLS